MGSNGMQSYRSRNRTSSLVEDLLVSALSHDGMETVEVRDLKVHEEAALIITFANHGKSFLRYRGLESSVTFSWNA